MHLNQFIAAFKVMIFAKIRMGHTPYLYWIINLSKLQQWPGYFSLLKSRKSSHPYFQHSGQSNNLHKHFKDINLKNKLLLVWSQLCHCKENYKVGMTSLSCVSYMPSFFKHETSFFPVCTCVEAVISEWLNTHQFYDTPLFNKVNCSLKLI